MLAVVADLSPAGGVPGVEVGYLLGRVLEVDADLAELPRPDEHYVASLL
jgi:hypothetical protein